MADTTYRVPTVATTSIVGGVLSGNDITVDSKGIVTVNSIGGQDVSDIVSDVDLSSYVTKDEKGAALGVAELNENGTVPSSQLPSYVDDVLEYNGIAKFPATGETGKIYVDTVTNLTYRWSGSSYVEISPSLALGTTSSTAYRGDYGNIAYNHSQLTSGNPHNVTLSDLGVTASSTELSYVDGVTSSVQDQLDSKISSISAASPISATTSSGVTSISHSSSGVTAGTSGSTSAQTPAFGGAANIPYLTVNATGHVTARGTSTVTIPSTTATSSSAGLMSASDKSKLDNISSSGNTDVNVTQTVTTSNASYPLLLAPSGQTSTTTTTSYFDSGVTLNPSTNTIAASISGTAATATKIGSSTVGSSTKPVYVSGGTVTACGDELAVDITGNAATATTAVTTTGVTTQSSTTTERALIATTSNAPGTGKTIYQTGYDSTNSSAIGTIYASLGTASSDGSCRIRLGNSTASGTAGNSEGILRLYGASTSYTNLKSYATTSTRTLITPNSSGGLVCVPTSGTAVGDTDTPVYVNSSGVVKECESPLTTAITNGHSCTYGYGSLDNMLYWPVIRSQQVSSSIYVGYTTLQTTDNTLNAGNYSILCGTSLRASASATTGTVTLNASISKFRVVDVELYDGSTYAVNRIFLPSDRTVGLFMAHANSSSNGNTMYSVRNVTFSGTSITNAGYGQCIASTSDASGAGNNNIYILNVIGYV